MTKETDRVSEYCDAMAGCERALVGIEKQLIQLNKLLRQDKVRENRDALDAIEREFGVKV